MKILPIEGERREEVLATLAESTWFRGLKQRAAGSEERLRQFEHLIASADLVEYAPGELIVEQGFPSDSFHVIVRGMVRVRLGEGEGRREVGTLRRPASFGEVGLLLEDARTASVYAGASGAWTLRFSVRSFHDVLVQVREFGLETARHLARRLREVSGLLPLPEAKLEAVAEPERASPGTPTRP
jgi:CRP-like cAMP-binding protein